MSSKLYAAGGGRTLGGAGSGGARASGGGSNIGASTLFSIYSTIQSTVQGLVPLATTLKEYFVAAMTAFQALLDKYPPIKVFVYSLLASSAVPILVFLGFTTFTLMTCLAVAGTGVALVQGGFLAIAGFTVFWFLLGSFILTGFVTFWFTVAYFAYHVAKTIERTP